MFIRVRKDLIVNTDFITHVHIGEKNGAAVNIYVLGGSGFIELREAEAESFLAKISGLMLRQEHDWQSK